MNREIIAIFRGDQPGEVFENRQRPGGAAFSMLQMCNLAASIVGLFDMADSE